MRGRVQSDADLGSRHWLDSIDHSAGNSRSVTENAKTAIAALPLGCMRVRDCRTHVSVEKPVQFIGIGNQLFVQVPSIPLDQYVPKVEDYKVDPAVHAPTIPAGAPFHKPSENGTYSSRYCFRRSTSSGALLAPMMHLSSGMK